MTMVKAKALADLILFHQERTVTPGEDPKSGQSPEGFPLLGFVELDEDFDVDGIQTEGKVILFDRQTDGFVSANYRMYYDFTYSRTVVEFEEGYELEAECDRHSPGCLCGPTMVNSGDYDVKLYPTKKVRRVVEHWEQEG